MIEVNSLEEARNYPDAVHIECGQTYKVYFKDDPLPDYLIVGNDAAQDHVEPEVVIDPIIEDLNKQIGILAQDYEFLYNQIGLLNQSVKIQKESLDKAIDILVAQDSIRKFDEVKPAVCHSRPWWKFWGKA